MIKRIIMILLISSNAYAGQIVLFGSDNIEKGTTTNPLKVSFTGGTVGGWTTDSSTKTMTTYNVGIGTANPTESLEVVGNLVVSGSITALGSENMGIGTILPSQKLEVVGTIKTTGLNVGIGTTVAQQLCRKPTGEIGYFNGAWASTCN